LLPPGARMLRLVVTPQVTVGEKIVARIECRNLGPVTVTIDPPDTVLISGERQVILGGGTGTELLEWQVAHAQKNLNTIVEIRARSGGLLQLGLCRVRG